MASMQVQDIPGYLVANYSGVRYAAYADRQTLDVFGQTTDNSTMPSPAGDESEPLWVTIVKIAVPIHVILAAIVTTTVCTVRHFWYCSTTIDNDFYGVLWPHFKDARYRFERRHMVKTCCYWFCRGWWYKCLRRHRRGAEDVEEPVFEIPDVVPVQSHEDLYLYQGQPRQPAGPQQRQEGVLEVSNDSGDTPPSGFGPLSLDMTAMDPADTTIPKVPNLPMPGESNDPPSSPERNTSSTTVQTAATVHQHHHPHHHRQGGISPRIVGRLLHWRRRAQRRRTADPRRPASATPSIFVSDTEVQSAAEAIVNQVIEAAFEEVSLDSQDDLEGGACGGESTAEVDLSLLRPDFVPGSRVTRARRAALKRQEAVVLTDDEEAGLLAGRRAPSLRQLQAPPRESSAQRETETEPSDLPMTLIL